LSFGTWRKLNATSVLPARCSTCGGLAFVSAWAHAATSIVFEALFWGAIIAAIALKSWLALFAFPVGAVIWSLSVGRVYSLKPIERSAVSASRRSAVVQIVVAIVLIFSASLVFGVK
jgi:hypothetical protein